MTSSIIKCAGAGDRQMTSNKHTLMSDQYHCQLSLIIFCHKQNGPCGSKISYEVKNNYAIQHVYHRNSENTILQLYTYFSCKFAH